MTNTEPGFSEEEATQFFMHTYHADEMEFIAPEWMPRPPNPTTTFNCDGISLDEIALAIRKSKTKSAPCPLDGVPYVVFKKCPALVQALYDIFNMCWSQTTVPTNWKRATVKLIGKPAAEHDPTLPSNFRPIALTSCIGKLFTTILRNRWISFLSTNHYFDKSIQKAFMPKTPGCIEHHLKLAEILRNAKHKHKSLTVCWLDLANAYGSVHHSLISFALKHYHAPPQFLAIIQSFYSNLSANINSSQWSTSPIPLRVGVYQGDPLSVVIFNTVINTMIDTIKQRQDLGYQYTNRFSVNLLKYADDICLTANSPASCQQLLHLVDRWLQWANMRVKVPKCQSLALRASVSKLEDPHLNINGQSIPIASEPVKFFGKSFAVPQDITGSKRNILIRLQEMLDKTNSCPLSGKHKLMVYKAGICPRLSWLLLIEELPISWVEKLDAIATRYIKRWTGLMKFANSALLYLPQNMGGLNLPLISKMYRRLKVTRQSQLLTSPDPCVRLMSENILMKELTLKRAKFKPSVKVREVMMANPDYSRRSLSNGAKTMIEDDINEEKFDYLLSLEKEGQMLRNTTPESAKLWGQALLQLSDDQMKFALNGALDTLPHNANLHLWKKKEHEKCLLCGERQTLIHVLNACPVSLHQRRYNRRHDAVLELITNIINSALQPSQKMCSDLTTYHFPHHIVPTTLRPDIVWWDDRRKNIVMAELTIPFETSFTEAAERKRAKYEDLLKEAKQAGYKTTLITLEVGSRGVINNPGFQLLTKRTENQGTRFC